MQGTTFEPQPFTKYKCCLSGQYMSNSIFMRWMRSQQYTATTPKHSFSTRHSSYVMMPSYLKIAKMETLIDDGIASAVTREVENIMKSKPRDKREN